LRAAQLTLLFALLLWPAAGQAWDFSIKGQDFSLDVTNTFKYGYHFVNDPGDSGDPVDVEKYRDDDKYHDIYNSLDVSLSHGDYRLGGRFDLNLFADTPFGQHCGGAGAGPSWCAEESIRYINDFNAERLFLVVAKPEFDLTIGDFYASFGNGLALNVVKIDALGQDTALRGGKLQVHTGNLGITLLGGITNPMDIDPTTGYVARWLDQPVFGARVEYNFFEKALVGAHAVATSYASQSGESTATVGSTNSSTTETVAGLGVDIPDLFDGALALSAEADLLNGEDLAAYASTTVSLGALCLLGEFKYYNSFQLMNQTTEATPYDILYHQPPTLERITAEIHDNTDIAGGRLRVDYDLGQLGPVELSLFANMGYFEDWHHDEDSRILNPIGGFELQWMDGVGHLEASAGMRSEQLTDDTTVSCPAGETPPCMRYQDIHAELSLEQGLFDKHSIKLGFELLDRKRRDPISELSWIETRIELSYKWSPLISVAYVYEYQGDPSYELSQRTAHYHMGIVRYFYTPSTYVEAKIGESKPGLKCVNGVCRNFPPFAGAQLTGVVRF
jgi:Family of unknown function (DUF6029)